MLAAVVGLLMVVGCAAASVGEAASCRRSVHDAEAKVRVDRWDPPEELPGLGDYPGIHWQERARGNPCSWLPGPTDWAHQGVAVLHPQDVRRLVEQYEFVPFADSDPANLGHSTTPADVWPDLVPYLPTGARWLHSQSYDDASPTARDRVAFLDVEHRTLLFMLNDH
ncbi:hypothetical protein GCM10027614_70400 [Micromonospora vulcania]